MEFSNPNEKIYVDASLFQSYEQEFAKSLEDYGFESVYLNSDSLLGITAGAINCVTMQNS